MAGAEKDKSFLSPLFSAEISTKDVLHLTQKLARRYLNIIDALLVANSNFPLLEIVNVDVTALVLILGTQLSRMHNGE